MYLSLADYLGQLYYDCLIPTLNSWGSVYPINRMLPTVQKIVKYTTNYVLE